MTPAEIREIRLSMGKSFVEMGDYVGVKARTIRNYESGKRKISKTIVLLLFFRAFYDKQIKEE